MRKTSIFFMLVLALVLGSQTVRAEDINQKLQALMVNLPGFKAGEAESASMNTAGMKMLTASRTYTKGQAVLNTTFVAGVGTEAYSDMGDINISTSDMRAKTRQINGFKVITNYDIPGNTGGVMVWLGSGDGDQGALVFSFQGMDDGQALELAQKFDWKALRALARETLK